VQLPLIRAVVRLAGGDAEKSSCATGDALANQTLDEFGGATFGPSIFSQTQWRDVSLNEQHVPMGAGVRG